MFNEYCHREKSRDFQLFDCFPLMFLWSLFWFSKGSIISSSNYSLIWISMKHFITLKFQKSCYGLVFTCFHLTKGRATYFRPETIVGVFIQSVIHSFQNNCCKFLYLMVFVYKVFIQYSMPVCVFFLLCLALCLYFCPQENIGFQSFKNVLTVKYQNMEKNNDFEIYVINIHFLIIF